MRNLLLARRLVQTLPVGLPGLYNPWRDSCVHDTPENGPKARFERLVHHLDCQPAIILVGEAPGYQGCRYTGVGFTSERLMLAGEIPRIPELSGRLTTRHLSFSEPSATIVWKALRQTGLAERTVLWNALQLHPHELGQPWTNRTPSATEFTLGRPALQLLIEEFSEAKIVAVGKPASRLLELMGVGPFAKVRHPANGGANEFTRGLHDVALRVLP